MNYIRKDHLLHRGLEVFKHMFKEREFAEEVYAALCNNKWKFKHSDYTHYCDWEFAGGLVAELRGEAENYSDFHLWGNEGEVTDRVGGLFDALGFELV